MIMKTQRETWGSKHPKPCLITRQCWVVWLLSNCFQPSRLCIFVSCERVDDQVGRTGRFPHTKGCARKAPVDRRLYSLRGSHLWWIRKQMVTHNHGIAAWFIKMWQPLNVTFPDMCRLWILKKIHFFSTLENFLLYSHGLISIDIPLL